MPALPARTQGTETHIEHNSRHITRGENGGTADAGTRECVTIVNTVKEGRENHGACAHGARVKS